MLSSNVKRLKVHEDRLDNLRIILYMQHAFMLLHAIFVKFMWISCVMINDMMNTNDFYTDVVAEVTLKLKAVIQFA